MPNSAGEPISAGIARNVARVRERIAAAALKSGRRPEEVTLVAVSKSVGPDEIAALVAAGCRDFGESRPQDLWAKAAAFSGEALRWHMIGHLQSNKIERTLPLVQLFHSLDRESLGDALNDAAIRQNRPVTALLEINISGEASKHGFAIDQAAEVVKRSSAWDRIRIAGLMGMSGLHSDPDQKRNEFAALRNLRERLNRDSPELRLNELSMGMSDDYEIAIEEGATIVRVGSALFE